MKYEMSESFTEFCWWFNIDIEPFLKSQTESGFVRNYYKYFARIQGFEEPDIRKV